MKVHHLLIRSHLIAVLAFATALAGGPKTDDCRVITRLAHYSRISEAKADYYLALANAQNLPDAEDRAEARKDALETYREDLALAGAQLKARRELCVALAENRYAPGVDPANFLSVAEIVASPNPFLPLTPGKTRHYRAQTPEGVETVDVQVTNETRIILGVTCIVVRDVVRLDGALVEDTQDWLAQDRAGNVWYFGERAVDYDADGLVADTGGSFEAGLESALPGILMPAQPAVGQIFRQEFFLGEAEDAARVLALNETVTVPFGTLNGCLKTEDFTPIEPGHVENKFYAAGIGRVLEVNVESGKRSELISITTP